MTQLSGFLADNILCLLSYNDQYSKIIRNSISLNLYSGPYRIIASRIYEYLDRFGKPPGDHLPDLLEDKISSENADNIIYRQLVISIKETIEKINTEFVVNQIQTFVKRQSLRAVAVDLTKALQRDTEEGLEEAERLIAQARQPQLTLFDPGTRLSDKTKALKFLEFDNECFPIGIKELDDKKLGPARKQLHLFIGNAKAGKTHYLTQLAKMAIINRLKVVHITLEMSEGRCAQRYFQTLYSIAKRPETSTSIKFNKDEYGKLIKDKEGKFTKEIKITPKHTLQDPDIRAKLEKIIDKWALRQLDNIYIKEFPTGSLTCEELEAYLDTLMATQGFTPDLLVLDYPDLMELEVTELRIALDRLFKKLRGIAVKRNLALAAVSQSNRSGAKAKTMDGTNVAESYSKIQHADVILIYSATAAERKLGLGRLSVIARNDDSNLSLVISQHYKTGTFVIDSALMTNDYWGSLPTEENTEE